MDLAFDVFLKCGLVGHQPLAAPATAADSLEQNGQAHRTHLGGNFVWIGPRAFGT